ncbi:alanine-glyoxylate transaminase/serine-glyoxylate transaminase/serine-pyruvate transaminase [Aliiruegeria haliotis]|uniref:Alanine-glyoxylate transaminase/serine-glyoxylate transaminase/serine-pyruvate transaminase n=1 Tax=Aliiruegeria haliotis TaxID=1280846 RepID=A0A2T0RWN9_9RHOB|nr:aminotransferase class V-fold PLP-dependent enzyme [Aliiruegeria haliotis]PRY25542.1 alanine-glyoxylate transaminase/serine-glyoxylate transaminase/serine-pyruvate transaminase [Aliiruegeria haliotis]
MTLSRGSHYLAIPGPSVIPDEVLRAMHRPAPNIYTGELHEIVDTIIPDLKRVAMTSGDVAIYICNGHGAWEAALSNVFSRGDSALALATGHFAHGWANVAEQLGIAVERLDFGRRAAIDLDKVEAALRADVDHRLKAVMCVQVDTATSVRNDIRGLRAVLDRVGHPALLMVDCIACLGVDELRMDDWGVDVMVTGSQKGLMTPPGLGFVYFNGRADAARDGADLATAYWDWRPRVNAERFYQYFCGTAPTHHLYGLRAALDLIHDEGMEAVWYRHAALARAIWAALDAWGAEGPLEMNLSDPAIRSHGVTAIRIGKENGARLRDWVSEHAGVTLGIGLGMASDEDPAADGYFRIGHMGHVNAQMVLGALGSIDTGLKALGIPHGHGALEAATAVLARA